MKNIECKWKLYSLILLGSIGVGITSIKPCFAQTNIDIVPDNTLGTEASRINNNINVNDIPSTLIEGGAERGQNLFHSLQEFNVNEGRGAYFVVPNDAIQNILTRVTGNNPSSINGILGTILNRNFDPTNANLFLINPNGIVFGENAKLNIGGSFIGSTADSIKFADDIEFSATNPENTGLLTVSVPLGLQYGKNPGRIEINSKAEPPRTFPEVFDPQFGLRVPDAKTLAILGGDVLLEGATLKAGGGRIELGSVTGDGKVSITPQEEGFAFGFEKVENFGDIRLSQDSAVDATGYGAGDVRVTGKNLTLTNSSVIVSTQIGTEKSAGIVVNTTEKVEIDGINDTFVPSGLYANNVNKEGAEETGNITVNTQQLIVRDRATVITNAYDGAGKGGDIKIEANNLKIEDGGKVTAATFTTGNGGNVNVDAQDVKVINTRNDGNLSELSALAKEGSTGNGGNVDITTNNLLVEGGAFISANTFGEGNGGDMTINPISENASSKVELLGFGGGLFVVAEDSSTGDAGSLTINSNKLLVENSAFVSMSNNGQGSAGNMNITTNDLLLKNSARVITGRENQDKMIGGLTIKTDRLLVEGGSSVQAGTSAQNVSLNIEAKDIQVIGTGGNNGNTPSSLSTSTRKESSGDGGNLDIKTNTLLIKDGAFVSTSTVSGSNGGDLKIEAEDVQVIGFGGIDNNNQPYPSGLFTAAEKDSTGDAGDLTITTKQMLVEDGAILNTGTNSTGEGGDLTINVSTLQIKNGGEVGAGTSNQGEGGDLTINDAQLVQLIGTGNNGNTPSSLSASAGLNTTGNAGDVNITTKRMLVEDGAFVATSTEGKGNGGNLSIIDAEVVEIIGTGGNNPQNDNLPYLSGLFTSAEKNSTAEKAGDLSIINAKRVLIQGGGLIGAGTSSTGDGGQLTITAETLQLKDGSRINALSQGSGKAGNINIELSNDFNADDGQVITQSQQSSGGNIEITTAKNIFLRNNSDIRTTLSTTAGSGGNITLDANAIVALEDSDILAFAPEGKGGNITFDTRAFLSDSLFSPTPQTSNRATLDALDGNNRVDVNASGSISAGNISGIPDISFLQNSLIELAQNTIDSEALIATSCVVRSKERNGTFYIITKQGFPYSPGDAVPSKYSAVEVQSVPNNTSATKPRRRWKMGDPIVEPTGVYRLANGRRILSRECGK
ncbi:filamentous hemagglutinin N-terminal domain-containing protein [Calothrix sp. CCY 0018]|uniref:two-partner secretion domain-containing protein n=1 Tax=Calothrix sp. CCY 0018 TaxID=3103864 RepID=UPI0039C60A4D